MTILRQSVFDPFVTSLKPVPCVCVCLARKASVAPASLEQGRHAHPVQLDLGPVASLIIGPLPSVSSTYTIYVSNGCSNLTPLPTR